ncbi:MAG: hypothetical protein GY787_07620 [Alteromonadales bacterium]|nr:hypothetical protein [Alteromonadales bacterium]
MMENVSFINIEDDDIDLILSFAVYDSDPCDIETLILMRTPSYECFLEEHERGVSVSFKNVEDSFRLKGVVLEVILFSQSSQSWIANRG